MEEINPKNKKIIRIIAGIAMIVLLLVVAFSFGATYTCSKSNGFLTNNLQCLNTSSLKHCYFPEKNEIYEFDPTQFNYGGLS